MPVFGSRQARMDHLFCKVWDNQRPTYKQNQ